VIVVGGSGLHFRAVVDPLTFPPNDASVRAELELLEPEALRSRLLEVDPVAGDHVDLANPRRLIRALEIHRLTGLTPTDRSLDADRHRVEAYEPRYPFRAVGVDPGSGVEARITGRLAQMEQAGLLDEVASLRHHLGRTASQAVGYKQLIPVVDGEISAREGFEAVAAATRSLVKRQRTYFRADPRIAWLRWEDASHLRVEAALASLELG
jgi:tRNA dimethylallyltransferase